jgi:hypothetical protein
VNLRAPVLLRLLFLLLFPAAACADEAYRIFESTAASVNGEVLFVSEVAREACFLRCAAMPGTSEEILSAPEVRDRLILDTLALQEQRKLLLGAVDNTELDRCTLEADTRVAACPSECKRGIASREIREWVRRKLLLRDFYSRRVAVFVEVKDDDVRKELARRSSSSDPGAVLPWDRLRAEMLEARIAQEIRNWQSRAASKSRLILSPLEVR